MSSINKVNTSYKIDLQKLCESLELGDLQGNSERITGGLLHRMYKIKTEKGEYAVKALNPQIMLREKAMGDYIFSEKVAQIAWGNGVRALPALNIEGENLHKTDGQYYLVFDWFEGKALDAEKVSIGYCRIIGEQLALIHKLDCSSLEKNRDTFTDMNIDWKLYLKMGIEQNTAWCVLFQEKIEKLYELERKINSAGVQLSQHTVVSHGDLDQKNVLWNKVRIPMIIDWESAAYVNPLVDLLDTALCWADTKDGTPDKDAFLAFVNSYLSAGGTISDEYDTAVIYLLKGIVHWLEYSIKRSLRIECNSDEEQLLGTRETLKTFQVIENHINSIPVILGWLAKIQYC